MNIFIKSIIIIISLYSFALSNDYYKLDDYDASYNKLKEPKLPPSKDKELHPSSIYKYEYPQKEKKKPSYSRIEVINNEQALNRIQEIKKITKDKDYLLLGLNSSVDLYDLNSKNLLALELGLKIGYIHLFNSNAVRTYIKTYGKIGLGNNDISIIGVDANIDFLFGVRIFNLYLGLGYGGEYSIKDNIIKHSPHINIGINKILNVNSNIDIGVKIPFYILLDKKFGVRNNASFVINYNYLR